MLQVFFVNFIVVFVVEIEKGKEKHANICYWLIRSSNQSKTMASVLVMMITGHYIV